MFFDTFVDADKFTFPNLPTIQAFFSNALSAITSPYKPTLKVSETVSSDKIPVDQSSIAIRNDQNLLEFITQVMMGKKMKRHTKGHKSLTKYTWWVDCFNNLNVDTDLINGNFASTLAYSDVSKLIERLETEIHYDWEDHEEIRVTNVNQTNGSKDTEEFVQTSFNSKGANDIGEITKRINSPNGSSNFTNDNPRKALERQVKYTTYHINAYRSSFL